MNKTASSYAINFTPSWQWSLLNTAAYLLLLYYCLSFSGLSFSALQSFSTMYTLGCIVAITLLTLHSQKLISLRKKQQIMLQENGCLLMSGNSYTLSPQSIKVGRWYCLIFTKVLSTRREYLLISPTEISPESHIRLSRLLKKLSAG
ncbi:protein YgfX [Marinifaba aquimaris]|uniref:protein YgfX n=1 Tax=Marinifaba aquimaris TaxID=2741323 RepID=UPI003CCCC44A